jgi:hypothetical protein
VPLLLRRKGTRLLYVVLNEPGKEATYRGAAHLIWSPTGRED